LPNCGAVKGIVFFFLNSVFLPKAAFPTETLYRGVASPTTKMSQFLQGELELFKGHSSSSKQEHCFRTWGRETEKEGWDIPGACARVGMSASWAGMGTVTWGNVSCFIFFYLICLLWRSWGHGSLPLEIDPKSS
jgi:hypothetical protein